MSDPEQPDSPTSPMRDESTLLRAESEFKEERIGPYRLIRRIGEGGFGTVYAAEQDAPIRRSVAIKILKLERDSREVVARFQQERQALALMDHPNVAKVLDAGATEDGRPYFVMEMVRGEAITTYCDTNNLPIRERLELFIQVCNAVQHAHQKGLIHRDIKPSNVLVSMRDDNAHAMIIDFGIAKATAARLTDASVFTEHRQMIGTLEYMSPEQAEGSLDIDTRTDVYSLGVLLYELLTGTTPVSSRELRQASLTEVLRILREVEPPAPSARASQISNTSPDIGLHRRISSKRLPSVIRGELDWIVMRALEKDRRRRYETANGLGMDIQRYLNGEPVVAAPPSASYRLRKLVQRHTAAVTAAALVAMTLITGIAVTGAALMRAERQRTIAVAAQQSEEVAREKADAINEFLLTVLISSDPNQGGRQTMQVSDAMKNAVELLDKGGFADQPEVELQLRLTIARILSGNAHGDQALPNAEKALAIARRLPGGGEREAADALFAASQAHSVQAKYEQTESLGREALAIHRRLDPEGTLGTAAALKTIAGSFANRGRFEEAEPFFREAMDVRRRMTARDDADLAQSINDYGYVQLQLGKKEEASALFTEAMMMRRRLFKGDHPHIAEAINNLAWSHERSYRFAEAEANYRQALEMYQRLFEGDHMWINRGLYNLGWNLSAQGRWAEAEPLLAQAAAMSRRMIQGPSPNYVDRISLRAASLLMMGRSSEASRLWSEAQTQYLEIRQDSTSSVVATTLSSLVDRMMVAYPEKGLELATALHRRAIEEFPRGSLQRAHELSMYGSALVQADTEETSALAEPVLREAIAVRERAADARVALDRAALGAALFRRLEVPNARALGKDERVAGLREAEALLEAGFEGLSSKDARLTAGRRAELLGQAAERLVRLNRMWTEIEPAAGREKKVTFYTAEIRRLR